MKWLLTFSFWDIWVIFESAASSLSSQILIYHLNSLCAASIKVSVTLQRIMAQEIHRDLRFLGQAIDGNKEENNPSEIVVRSEFSTIVLR